MSTNTLFGKYKITLPVMVMIVILLLLLMIFYDNYNNTKWLVTKNWPEKSESYFTDSMMYDWYNQHTDTLPLSPCELLHQYGFIQVSPSCLALSEEIQQL